MTDTNWFWKGKWLEYCSCDWGCPCESNAPPSRGHCDGVVAMHIDEGHYGDVKLDGITVAATFFFPRALHQAGGHMQPILPAFASDEEYFKYGSIGNDGAGGIPYPIWIAMPDVCAHHLPRPQGYAAFGLLYERGRNPAIDPPIGFSRAKVGVERMAINCAVCHTVRARLAADAEPQFYVGAAANTVDIQGYLRTWLAATKIPASVRLTIDVDPISFF